LTRKSTTVLYPTYLLEFVGDKKSEIGRRQMANGLIVPGLEQFDLLLGWAAIFSSSLIIHKYFIIITISE
jgi:hypothetical protein